ncbi:MAG: hypothetical protein ACRDO0_01165 [Nocardioidaceae bacterium]
MTRQPHPTGASHRGLLAQPRRRTQAEPHQRVSHDDQVDKREQVGQIDERACRRRHPITPVLDDLARTARLVHTDAVDA